MTLLPLHSRRFPFRTALLSMAAMFPVGAICSPSLVMSQEERASGASAATSSAANSDETVADAPRPTPVTRPEMKRLLEEMKNRTPRITLPPLSAEEQEKEKQDPRTFGYEGRLTSLFLPNGGGARSYLNFSGTRPVVPGTAPTPAPNNNSGRPAQPEDPALTLSYAFKTRLFWIASRANNCQYCLGHQESKLSAVGMLEDQIAALDSDWSAFPESEQVAFALARRLTLEPHRLSDADIDACRKHYNDLQILEMVLSVSGNNAINRWKEGVGVPQSSNGGNFGGAPAGEAHSYLSPTSSKYEKKPSLVAPGTAEVVSISSIATLLNRGKPLSEQELLEELEKVATRKPRLPLASEADTAGAFRFTRIDGAIPQWIRLLANFPVAGKRQLDSLIYVDEKLDISPELRAHIDWLTGKQDRAWYAMSRARNQLLNLGLSDQQVLQLDEKAPALSDKERALLVVAMNLAASPVVLTDREVAHAIELNGARDVVQTIHYTAMRAMYNRFTEAALLSTSDE